MYRTFIALSILIAGCSSTSAVYFTADSALKGVHAVYINPADARLLTSVERTLPQIRIVTDPAQADAVIDFAVAERHGTAQSYANATYESGTEANGGLATHTVSVPIGSPTSSAPSSLVARAVNRTNGKTTIIYYGFREYLGQHFAENFVKAWRAANG